MHHAEHFLSRLDRLPRSEVDLALDLYRDPDLLRAVLEAASLPEQAPRVAISIDDPTFGPFLVVTRDGHFVTCLGRGMRCGDLPVVTRTQLDTISRKVTSLRDTLALEEQMSGGGERASTGLVRRVLVAPDSVSREDFLAVAVWEPILGPVFLEMYLAMACELAEQGAVLRRVRGRGKHVEEALHTYWNLLHATGHMALLGAISGEKEQYASLTEQQLGSRAAFSWPLTGTGVVTFIVKGAWAAGRVGKLMLADYKRALAEDVAFFELLDTLFTLLAIGLRSKGTRAEIQKAIRAAPGTARGPEAQRLRELRGREIELCCKVTADMLDVPLEEHEAMLLELGKTFFDPGAPASDDPLRADLARTIPLMSWTDGITDGRRLMRSLGLIAATARGGPEQFYLPRVLSRELRETWKPEHTWMVLDPIMRAERSARKPDVREVKVGRNERCTCGSGKKWKRCCGA